MIPIHCIIIILLFTISITILVVGTIKDIQGCIFGGILSILVSAMVTMGITMRRRTAVKIIKPPVVKENIINNTAPIITITPITPIPPITPITAITAITATAPTIIPMPTDIINPIYETV